MDLIISFIATALGLGLALVGLNKNAADRVSVFRNSDPNETFTSKNISKVEKIILLVVVALLCFASTMKIMDKVHDVIGISKMVVCLLGLLGAACFDYREHRIPNIFPLFIVMAAVLLLGLGVLTKQVGAVAYITTGILSSIVCGLILVVASVVTKQGIGAGDIKLICTIALIAGVYAVMGTLFFGVLSCSVYGIIALILKKKSVSSAVPFGPFLLLGYVLTLFIINF